MAVSDAKKKSGKRPGKPFNERHVMGFLFTVAVVLSVFLGSLLYALQWLAIPGISSVAHYHPPQTTLVTDRNGRVIDRIFSENRTVINLGQMPPLLPKAFVAAEDGRFYEHPGLDFFSVIRALVNNLRTGRKSQGGSTITQQVAKGLLLSSEKTYLRKIKEAILAWRIDTMLTKDEIIYIYLNHIYLGEGAYGVEAAAQAYFGKAAARLSLAEIAMLAGLPQAPSRYSPKDHWPQAQARQRYVLNRMAEDGYITPEQAQSAFGDQLQLIKDDQQRLTADGYYLAEVRNRARHMLDQPLETAGLIIHTNFDPVMQLAAFRSVQQGIQALSKRGASAGIGSDTPEGALVCMELCSGRVRALTGGSDYVKTPFNRAVQARRPAGSVFKPILYGAAFERGLSPQTMVVDEPLAIGGAGGKTWRPHNFSGKFLGSVTIEQALVNSYNIPAIKVMQRIGVGPVHDLARRAGISGDLPPDLSLALGAVDVSLLEMTGAYVPLLCDGVYRQPNLIARITTADNTELYHERSEPRQVLSGANANRVKQLLVKVIAEGTGKRAAGLPGLSGGKTGTSDDSRDAWFIGFHGRLAAGLWFGYDRNHSLGDEENGGRTAAPAWRSFMAAIPGEN